MHSSMRMVFYIGAHLTLSQTCSYFDVFIRVRKFNSWKLERKQVLVLHESILMKYHSCSIFEYYFQNLKIENIRSGLKLFLQ